ncbi:hypothetical protein SDC9_199573 [bioreactor metagenome]|uniref:Uncharacterized protein n=1 Tax=bioreactor metagenome TaxID=1076179 RepID=A0A645IM53_9ZZZZ
MVLEVFVVSQLPLAPGVFVRPVVPFPRKINPFRMSELVAHKIQVASVYGSGRNQPDHLM